MTSSTLYNETSSSTLRETGQEILTLIPTKTNGSYNNLASQRIQKLENLVEDKLLYLINCLNSFHSDLYSTNGLNKDSINHERIAFKKYLIWVAKKLEQFRELVERMKSNKRSRKSYKLKQQEYLKNISMEVDQQIACLTRSSNGVLDLKSYQFYSQSRLIDSSKQLGPIAWDGMVISEIISDGIEIYLKSLDKESFWLDRGGLNEAMRSPGKSLLKQLLFDCFYKISALNRYGPESSYLEESTSVATLIPHCYANPNREGVIAMLFLTIEETWKLNFIKGKLYLAQAFRLADMLQINPDTNQFIDEFTSNRQELWKTQLWEILLFVHFMIFTAVPGASLVQTKSKMTFNHLHTSNFCLPTTIRLFKSTAELEGYSSKKKVCVNFSESKTREFNLDETTLYYKEGMQRAMRIYQILLSTQFEYKDSEDTFKAHLKLTPTEFQAYKEELDTALQRTPQAFRSPYIIPEFYLSSQMHIKEFSCELPCIASLAYTSLLFSKFILFYPLAVFDPRPQKLKNEEAWDSVLDTANLLYDFFAQYLLGILTFPNPAKIQIINLTDMLPAIYTYLNCIIQNASAPPQYQLYLYKAQTLIYNLEAVLVSDRAPNDARLTHDNLSTAIVRFVLPYPYHIRLRNINEHVLSKAIQG